VSQRPNLYKTGQRDSNAQDERLCGASHWTAKHNYLKLNILRESGVEQPTVRACGILSHTYYIHATASFPYPTRPLVHFKAPEVAQAVTERLSFTTFMMLKKGKAWPLILVSDLPPEIGRAIGYVLDAFPGTKLMNCRHYLGTAQ